MMNTRILALAIGLAFGLGSGTAFADAAAGEKVFKKCKSCHSLDAGKNKVGPSLAAVIGRKAGSVSGYKYSASLKAAGDKGLVWGEENLEKFLKNPKTYLRAYLGDKKAKSKMVYKLKKDKDRDNIIAYLESKSK